MRAMAVDSLVVAVGLGLLAGCCLAAPGPLQSVEARDAASVPEGIPEGAVRLGGGGYVPPPSMRYLVERTRFLNEESLRVLGSRLSLSPAEQRVNALLMRAKRREYAVPEAAFPPARHFFHMRDDIERSQVFKFIQRMPKGAVLHVHDLAAANADFIVQNISYRDHVWGRVAPQAPGQPWSLKFSRASPGADWRPLAELRRAAASVEEFDATLRTLFTIVVDDPDAAYPDQATAWDAFNNRFDALFCLLTYKPVFRDYFWRTLQDFYEDNVMYVELRGVLLPMFDLDGNTYDSLHVATLYKEVADDFKKAYPDFLGVRLIYAPSRHVSVTQVREYVTFFRKLKAALPDFVAGFDLVAHEDDGRPLIDFVPELLQLRQDLPDVKYFFHAGETNWEHSSTDENLVDAVLLNTTRIGHGYAIDKHPKVMDLVKQRGIGIEINPISNQVLNLVQDLRNHPGAALLADDFPVVISSDDPGMWDARGLSHDFYEAFMGMGGLKADLRTLKQLVVNSIQYSAMGPGEKAEALAAVLRHWARFIASEDRQGHGARPRAAPQRAQQQQADPDNAVTATGR